MFVDHYIKISIKILRILYLLDHSFKEVCCNMYPKNYVWITSSPKLYTDNFNYIDKICHRRYLVTYFGSGKYRIIEK